MTTLDVGPGMGYFSLWMANAVGTNGKVVCVDIQEKMIRSLTRRAAKAGVGNVIDARVCREDSLAIDDLSEQVDFCLAFAVAHEIPEVDSMFRQIHKALKPGAFWLVAEPKGHVGEKAFEKTINVAIKIGFEVAERPAVARSHAALLGRS